MGKKGVEEMIDEIEVFVANPILHDCTRLSVMSLE